jgi:hypothetical protein
LKAKRNYCVAISGNCEEPGEFPKVSVWTRVPFHLDLVAEL